MLRYTVSILLAGLLPAAVAAATTAAEENPWKSETFLSDYSLLKPVPAERGQDFVYGAPGVEEGLARFDSVMVDQPEISFSPASPYKSAKPDDLKAIAEFLRKTIAERLESRGFKIVEQKGESVLYLRVALTDLQLKKKRRGVLSYTPVGAVVHEVKAAVQNVMKEVDIIDLAGQAEIAASQTGEVLGAMVTRRGAVADTAGTAKIERMTFDEFRGYVENASDRLACRINNARRPPDRRVDCGDPAARAAALGGSPGT